MQSVTVTNVSLDELLASMRTIIQQEIKSTVFEEKEHGSTPVSGEEIRKWLGISEPTLIRWRKKGKIPFLQVGGSYRYDKNAVAKALAGIRVINK